VSVSESLCGVVRADRAGKATKLGWSGSSNGSESRWPEL
jgi:hypothetical protein